MAVRLVMYKIIGADQKEYGPVSADQIREWIAQGRANGQTVAQAEGSGEWKPLSSFAEFGEALAALAGTRGPTAEAPPIAGATPDNRLDRDYQLDVFGCISRAWELVKEDFWTIIGTTLVVLVATIALNQFIGLYTKPSVESLIHGHFTPRSIMVVALGSLAGAPVYSVFYGGLFWFMLKKIRGEEAGAGDAFAGFGSAFGQLALLGLVKSALLLVGFALLAIVVKGVLLLTGCALLLIPVTYLSTAWIFSEPLVIDKRLGFWEAMELSRKSVTRHWLTVFCLLLLVGLVMMAGLVACCIGVIVTVPIGYVAMMFAYEDIFRG